VLKRVPLYIFPLYLAAADYIVREFMTETAPLSVVGPSIVAAGMVLLFPVLIPRSPAYHLPPRVQAALEQRNLAIYSVADQHVTFAAWICLFILAGVWIYTIYLAHENPPVQWHIFPVTLLVGSGSYLIGVLFTELKGLP
jgi:hypothetical protein